MEGFFHVLDTSNIRSGKAHIFDQGSDTSDFTNRVYPIYECVSIDEVEKTLYISNEKLDFCEILIRDVSSTHLDE